MGKRVADQSAHTAQLAAVLRRLHELDGAPEGRAPFSEALLRSLLHHSPEFISTITTEGRLMFLNRTAPGFSLDEVIGTSVFDYLAPESHEPARACFRRVTETGKADSYPSVVTRPDGIRTHYQTRVGPIFQNGQVIALTIMSRDVSTHVETARALRETEQSLSLIAERGGIGVWSWDMATGAWQADDIVAAILGVEPDDLPERYECFLHKVHPADRADLETAIARSLSPGPRPELEFRVLRPSGEERWISNISAGLRDESGVLVKVVGGAMDITDHVRSREQQRQQQKLSAIGQLCAGIAHNFNNQLTGVLANLELAKRRADSEMLPLVTDAITAARGAADVVKQLVRFAGTQGGGVRRTTDLTDLLERLVKMCRRTFDGGVRITLDVDADLPALRVNATEIEQALLNLLINARDARIPEHHDASIDITAETYDSNAPESPGDQSGVRIRIRDNGAGMTPEVKRRVFEPFFTTKDVGKGTGLGLATTYAIIKDHGGSVRCTSSPGAGTTFTVLLPATPTPSADYLTPDITALPPQGSETILVVDDEDVVRRAIQRVLAGVGYEVLPASSSEEATAVLAARRGEVALIVIDVSTIAGTGNTLVQRLRDIDNRVAIMGLSGYGTDAMHGLGVSAMQAKPIDFGGFLHTVRELLDARPSSGNLLAPALPG